jgi:heterodisulfide reductase subunit A-like polyferredoxin
MTNRNASFWLRKKSSRHFRSLAESLGKTLKDQTAIQCDVAVIGAGITGLTAALKLKSLGRSVILLDMNEVGAGDTGHTTAHLTAVLDTR